MSELWKHVPGMCGVFASSKGRIMRPGARNGKVKTGTVGSSTGRYYQVKIKQKQYFVHRLVLQAFEGPCPEGNLAMHANDDGFDNWIQNLTWGTPAENNNALGRLRRCAKTWTPERRQKYRERQMGNGGKWNDRA